MPVETLRRRYDKGENRRKHIGKGDHAQIAFDDAEPKKWIGKCPNENAMPRQLRDELLNEAIPAPAGDRNIDYVKTLFVVHLGAIYAAQTSDGGVTYHGYPYRGKLHGIVLELLEIMAKAKGCDREFRQ